MTPYIHGIDTSGIRNRSSSSPYLPETVVAPLSNRKQISSSTGILFVSMNICAAKPKPSAEKNGTASARSLLLKVIYTSPHLPESDLVEEKIFRKLFGLRDALRTALFQTPVHTRLSRKRRRSANRRCEAVTTRRNCISSAPSAESSAFSPPYPPQLFRRRKS